MVEQIELALEWRLFWFGATLSTGCGYPKYAFSCHFWAFCHTVDIFSIMATKE